MHKVTPSEAKVLEALARNYPNRLTRAQVSEAANLSIKSSTFDGAFPKLRDLGLIEGKTDFAVVASLVESDASARNGKDAARHSAA